MADIIPRVVDIYHGDNVEGDDCVIGFKKAAAAGVWGVIHKSSQGVSYKDTAYNRRREAANQAGLLWGAYHFNSGDDIADQVKNFINAAAPDSNTLMVLDFEDNPRSNMSIHEAVSFMKLVEDKIGRNCAIYSGNRIKENIRSLSSNEFDYITSKKLWLCQYGAKAVLPYGFKSYWLWQYTGDGMGPLPHYVPGISVQGGRGIDLNCYNGSKEQLILEWSGKDIKYRPAPEPTKPLAPVQPPDVPKQVPPPAVQPKNNSWWDIVRDVIPSWFKKK